MAEVIQNKFVVIKRDDIDRYLSADDNVQLARLLWKIERGRATDEKGTANKYWICNQDEPYADKVLQTILAGEDTKREARS